MARYDLPIDYPDGQAPTILAALKARFPNADGSVPTNAEALASYALYVKRDLRQIVETYVGKEARANAAIDIT